MTDTGPGLPKRAQEHLFTPFQGGVSKGGTGLGLAIAQELIRGHGGDLTLNRTDETGTQFRILLPKSDATLDTCRSLGFASCKPSAAGLNPTTRGLVAQLDRVLDYESRGRGFESSPVRHFSYLIF